ncbi:MAG: molybdate ABC transporter substrate-binding protein [Sulfitobacter sp.]|nr:molybdate ABC transporter substrate-binding protein [Sulfitobacter sp.]
MKRRALLLCLALGLALPRWVGAEEKPVIVLAAASLAGALEEAAQGFSTPTVFSYGGSGTMARQVAAGAPADLVLLASPIWAEWLLDQGHLEGARAVPFATNRLVVIGPAGAPPLDPQDLFTRLEGGRLAMGQRDAVPAGIYARQWLTAQNLWEPLVPHLAETDNVRAALALVARGQAPLGIVYASDAAAEPAVAVLHPIPPDPANPILYVAAPLTEEGSALLRHLLTDPAQQAFAARGFLKVTP